MSASAEPIRQRFALLHDQWVSFAENAAARVLIWRVRDDERRMLDAFLAKESDPDTGELPDLFLRLDAPFVSADAYALALREALIATAQAFATSDETFGSWSPPPLVRNAKALDQVLAACASFHVHLQLTGQLALVLEPRDVTELAAFTAWLGTVARAAPANVRFVVLDAQQRPALALPPADEVLVQEAELDMPRALLDVSRAAGNLDTPGGMYRHLYVAFTAALGAQDLARAEALAARLLVITAAQGWFALEVPLHFALGAQLAAQARPDQALQRYAAAEQSAQAGEQAGDPSCAKLRMQARMVRGGLLLSEKAYDQAAKLFVETLPIAQALSDARSVIDCHRLASFSREQEGKLRPAWQHGLDALAFAHTVDAETLKSSTLKFLAEGMQRIAKHADFRAQGPRVQRDFDQLLAEPKPASKAAKA